MIKKCSKVLVLIITFLTGVFLGSAIARNGVNGTNYDSITRDFQNLENRKDPNLLQTQPEKKMNSIRESSKMELNQSPDQLLEDIRRIEYNEIKYDEQAEDYYGFIKGRIPILISAPHGARHFRKREHRWKGEDEYTASLAIKLGELTGAYVIYVRNKTTEDPNNDPSSKYKMAVAKAVKQYHIKFLLDLHGSDEERPYKIDIGTISNESGKGSCPTFKETIREALSDFGPRIFNQTFCASDASTMTSFARNELGIEAAQLEINAKYRIVDRKPDSSKARNGIEPYFRANEKDVLDLVAKLEQMIYKIDEKGEKEPCLAKSE